MFATRERDLEREAEQRTVIVARERKRGRAVTGEMATVTPTEKERVSGKTAMTIVQGREKLATTRQQGEV